MKTALEVAFWIGIFWLGYVYVLYPAVLLALSHFKKLRFTAKMVAGPLPRVSVLISARNEVRDIGWKIAETLAWDYPADKLELLVASDGSQDGTDDVLKSISDPRFRHIRLEPQHGKAEALNRLARMAQGDLLFFTDANSHIGPACLQKIARPFADPKVGCVTGSERTLRETQNFAMAIGTRAFLGYESFVNTLESKLGSVLVCDGSVFCIRAELFSDLQPELANDFELPLRIGAAGFAVLFDPAAVSWERAPGVAAEEFNRKRRISCQGFLGLWRLRHHVRGSRRWQFFSRKLLRWLGAIPLALIFISTLGLLSNPLYLAALIAQLLFYLGALVGWLCNAMRWSSNRLLTFPFYFLMVNIGALAGVISVLLGSRFSTWDSPDGSRGTLKGIASASFQQSVGATLIAPRFRPELRAEVVIARSKRDCAGLDSEKLV